MKAPVLRPPVFSEADSLPAHGAGSSPASPKRNRMIRPGWKATIVRDETFKRLRDIQKSTTDPVIDLSYLTDACLRIALEVGAEQIVQRALADLRPLRTTP